MTAKDEVLVRLADQVRADRADDERFERVARGEADPNEVDELERRARDNPEIAARLDGSRPFDQAAIERMALRVASERPKPSAVDAPVKPSAVVVPISIWRRRVLVAAGPLAVAAAALLFIAGERSSPGLTLPEYSVTAAGEQAMRGPSTGATRLHVSKAGARDARFELLVRPASAMPSKIAVFAFSFGEVGTEPSPLEAKVEVSTEGAVRIVGASSALTGAREVRVVVADPSAIAGFEEANSRAVANRSDARVRVLVVPVDHD
jgi:hypothetical protein